MADIVELLLKLNADELKTICDQALEDLGLTRVLAEVAKERQRQISAEGWSQDHDDQHDRGELAAAAACYAHFGWMKARAPTEWPWAAEWWKPKDRRRDLIRAAALIVAEIERLDRASAPSAPSAARSEP